MRKVLLAAVAAAALAAPTLAHALVYVGSWTVDQGPPWPTVPAAYTGQETAALLFGGSPSDYAISTVDSNPANVNYSAWVSVWGAGGFADCTGFPCGRIVPHDLVTSTGGLYQNPGDESAYVLDWAVGPDFRNFAFLVGDVPAPAAVALFGLGLAALGLRRR